MAWPAHQVAQAMQSDDASEASARTGSPLLRLPPELMQLIVEDLQPRDLRALCSTNRYLHTIAKRPLAKHTIPKFTHITLPPPTKKCYSAIGRLIHGFESIGALSWDANVKPLTRIECLHVHMECCAWDEFGKVQAGLLVSKEGFCDGHEWEELRGIDRYRQLDYLLGGLKELRLDFELEERAGPTGQMVGYCSGGMRAFLAAFFEEISLISGASRLANRTWSRTRDSEYIRVEARVHGPHGASRISCADPLLLNSKDPLCLADVIINLRGPASTTPSSSAYSLNLPDRFFPAIGHRPCEKCDDQGPSCPPIYTQSLTVYAQSLTVINRAPKVNMDGPTADQAGQFALTPTDKAQDYAILAQHGESWEGWWDPFVPLRLHISRSLHKFRRLRHLHLEGVRIEDFDETSFTDVGFLRNFCCHKGSITFKRCIMASESVSWTRLFTYLSISDTGTPYRIASCKLQDLQDYEFRTGLPEARLRSLESYAMTGCTDGIFRLDSELAVA